MEKRKLNAWITKEQLDFIKLSTSNKNNSVSDVIRDMIDFNMTKKSLETSLDRVSNIIDKQVNISLEKYLNRIIKLVVKNTISSESANFNTAEILSSIRKQDILEVKEISRKSAIRYMQKVGDDFE